MDKQLLTECRKIEILTRRTSGILAGAYRSAFRGRGLDFDRLKIFEDGDDVRYIHWPASAKGNGIFVKNFTEERMLSVYAIVDFSASMGFGSLERKKYQVATEVAAALVFSAANSGDNVGLLLSHCDTLTAIPQRKGRDHALDAVTRLLKSEVGGAASLRAALESVKNFATKRSVIFIVSDFIDGDLESLLRHLSHRHDVMAFIIEDPMESQLPNLGFLHLRDSENGTFHHIDTSSAGIRDEYAHNAMIRRRKLENEFRSADVDFVRLYTYSDVVPVIADFFKRRSIHV